MKTTVKLLLPAGIAAVSLAGLAPAATASDRAGDASTRQLFHVLEANDHVGRAVHKFLNPC